jgi:hypothetical protein
MIYYQISYSYSLEGKPCTLLITRSCADAEYPQHLQETKTIAAQTMRENNNGVLPVFTETVNTLTLTQFNAIVKGPDNLEINPELEAQAEE